MSNSLVQLQLEVTVDLTDEDLTPGKKCDTVLELAEYYQTMLAEGGMSVEEIMDTGKTSVQVTIVEIE